MKTARSMIDLREHALLTRPTQAVRDDLQLELHSHVYRSIRPSVSLPQRRVVQAQIREMKLPSDTAGFGYDFYDAARGMGRITTREVQFGRQDACDLRTETHALKTVILKPDESFVRFIHEGGSGAKPYVVRLPNGHEVLRKLMLQGSFKKQDEEAKGEEVIRGFGQGSASFYDPLDLDASRHTDPLDLSMHSVKSNGQGSVFGAEAGEGALFNASDDPRINDVLSDPDKVDLLQEFIRDTRPSYFSRYVATLREPGKERIYASFFDQEFVKGCEFAKAIRNDNHPLSAQQVEQLTQAQLDILEVFYDYQALIYQEPVLTDEQRQQSSDYYLNRLQSRILKPLEVGDFNDLWLSLPLVDERSSGAHERFTLHDLFSQASVQINGTTFENPLFKLGQQLLESPSPYLGWSMHGDPQQTNFLLQSPMPVVSAQDDSDHVSQAAARKARLLCIDNRPAQITPYTADLEKAVWGSGWVPVFQGDVKPCLSAAEGKALAFTLAPRPDAQHAVVNFQKFEQKLQVGLARAPWFQRLSANDPTLQKRLALASVTQCLCDIGIAVKRLEQARRAIVAAAPDLDLPGTQQLIQMLTERIVGDFLLACQNYAHVQP